ncbi:aromatic ring-hydroxylating oxygenase subunit alpha [Saccharolobus sp. E5-1-F]|uniref:aromatic ring-hydroxylating oxygenase subunit alpha n=1 Tax=Saccharolobus sp. E5-1-F TaxID=2663019 RepID=UPI0013868B47|nr:Rieske 2Fe-2S domain-containing protein [Sulfolobus sp. E5-1-F]
MKDVYEILEELKSSIEGGYPELPLSMYASRELFELEMKKLWPRVWHFLAHESEIPNEGDYVLRYIGPNVSVIVAKGDDGKIRAFLNVCRHRGRAFSKVDRGNASFFRCPYHFWTYSNKGDLVGIPQDETFSNVLDRSKYGLIPVRIENYKGFIFGNLDGKAESLENYLGEFKWYLDLAIRGGDVEVYGNPIRWVVNMSWKAPVDNFGSDSYHIPFTHRSTYSISANPLKLEDVGLQPPEGVKKVPGGFSGYQFASAKGHGGGITSLYDITQENLDKIKELPVPEKIYQIYPPGLLEHLKGKLSEDQLLALKMEMLTLAITRIRVFPNLALIVHSLFSGEERQKYVQDYLLRVWRPVDVDKTEVLTYCLVPKSANEDYKRASYRQCIFMQDASGILDVDDVENWIMQTRMSASVIGNNVKLPMVQRLKEGPVEDFPLPHSKEVQVFREPADKSSLAWWKRYVEILLS